MTFNACVWQHATRNEYFATVYYMNDDMDNQMASEGPTFKVDFGGVPYDAHDQALEDELRKDFWAHR